MKLRIIFFTLTVVCALTIKAQKGTIKIIPEPLEVEEYSGYFILDKDQAIQFDSTFSEAEPEISLLQELLENKTAIELPLVQEIPNGKTDITIFRDKTIENKEGYTLKIDAQGVHIGANDRAGLFYGVQTLLQLLPEPIENKPLGELPYLEIKDSPRFPYRALMLDPARYFLPIEGIKDYIDVMAAYKFNYLHLHLTDDHGWRVQIKKYPLLTEIGSKRKETQGNGIPHEGFYTQEELKDLVAYAKSRHVEIIPEIDMPGHSMSILAAYPDLACFPKKFEPSTVPGVSKELLCAGKEDVYHFYENVIAEVSEIFPNPLMHIGGDEAPLDQWKKSPHCQEVMRRLGLENEEELMSYFFKRINGMLKKHGKKPLLWYESNVDEYPNDATVILWRMEEPDVKLREIQSKGLQMINSYGGNVYFDYPQWKGDLPTNVNWMPVTSLEKVYAFDPVRGLSKEESQFILGVEGCVWGEYVHNMSRAFYMTYPRALALSEAGWSINENRSWENFKKKLDKHFIRFINVGVSFRPSFELSEKSKR